MRKGHTDPDKVTPLGPLSDTPDCPANQCEEVTLDDPVVRSHEEQMAYERKLREEAARKKEELRNEILTVQIATQINNGRLWFLPYGMDVTGPKSSQRVLISVAGGVLDEEHVTYKTPVLPGLWEWDARNSKFPPPAIVYQDQDEIHVMIKGQTGSKGFPALIEYSFTVSWDGETSELIDYRHEGYPTHFVNFSDRPNDPYVFEEGNVFELFGSGDVTPP